MNNLKLVPAPWEDKEEERPVVDDTSRAINSPWDLSIRRPAYSFSFLPRLTDENFHEYFQRGKTVGLFGDNHIMGLSIAGKMTQEKDPRFSEQFVMYLTYEREYVRALEYVWHGIAILSERRNRVRVLNLPEIVDEVEPTYEAIQQTIGSDKDPKSVRLIVVELTRNQQWFLNLKMLNKVRDYYNAALLVSFPGETYINLDLKYYYNTIMVRGREGAEILEITPGERHK